MPVEAQKQFFGTVSETVRLSGTTITVNCETQNCALFRAGAVSPGTVIPCRPETFLDRLGQPATVNNCASSSAPVIDAGKKTCSGIRQSP